MRYCNTYSNVVMRYCNNALLQGYVQRRFDASCCRQFTQPRTNPHLFEHTHVMIKQFCSRKFNISIIFVGFNAKVEIIIHAREYQWRYHLQVRWQCLGNHMTITQVFCIQEKLSRDLGQTYLRSAHGFQKHNPQLWWVWEPHFNDNSHFPMNPSSRKSQSLLIDLLKIFLGCEIIGDKNWF